ncbi:hypothetical protein BHM03_00011324, partial [Ensete ventricosum]
CPNPSCPLCAIVVVAALAQATVAIAYWQLPCQGAATPVTGAAALAGDRVGHGRQPIAGALQPAPLCGRHATSSCARWRLSPLRAGHSRSCLRVALLLTGAAPAGCYPRGWLPPRAGAVGLPCRLALTTAGRPLVGGLGRDLAMGGRPYMGVGRGWSRLLLIAFTAKT